MAVPVWNPGTLYQPGDIVQPITAPAATAAQVENGDFAAGNVNWDFTGGAEFVTTGGYSGNGNCVRMPGSVPEGLALNKTKLVVPSTGSTFEATAMIQQGASIAGATRGWVEVRWYDSSDLLILSERGNVVSDGSRGAWHQSKLTATRPAGAAYARAGIALFSVADHTHAIFGDNLSVSGTFAGLPDGLVYKAVQPESGFSANDEPAWPPILGQQVIDNDVIWEAVASTRVTWEASPLYVSGSVEPDWPTDIGGFVRDGTIDWKAVSRRVEDPNCPNSKIVVIAASKVFAGDDDIVRYSATVNPLDWTTPDDAGYLPTGLQNYGANPVAAMGLYRSNLVVFNSEAFQLWQVDEDPASMALIDALPLGSTQHRSIAPVANDLFFASSQGIRSIGIAASSTNYQAGDVGMPIDPLVEPIMRLMKGAGTQALGLYYPSAGQYWLSFPGYPPAPLSAAGNEPDGVAGDNPGATTYRAFGGIGPYRWAITAGALPTGRSLNAETGVVTGSQTTAGAFSWTVRVTDAQGNTFSLPDTASVVAGNVALSLVANLPPAGPSGTISWSPDDQYLAISSTASPYLWVYKRVGDTFTALTLPATGMVSRAQGLTWSPDGATLAVAPESTAFPFVLRRTGDTFALQTLGDQLPNAQERGLVYSPTGDALKITYANAIYGWTVNGGAYTQAGKSADLPPASAFTLEASDYSADGKMFATGLTIAPWLALFSVSGGAFLAEAVPPGVASGAKQPRFSPDSKYLGWATTATPYVKLYRRSGEGYAFTDMAGVPASDASAASFAWSPTSANFAVGGSMLRIYKRAGSTVTITSTYPIGSVVGISWSRSGQYIAALRNGGTTVLRAQIS
ncbi:putative Ig domain-containing protein [Stenotrophomonas bentonitica]|uniref:putative Ig domain-containing protein n=1 Tax=Stenotrophomonas bentonitica TaxID=1450134 RepID=UPI0036E3ACAC